MSNKDFTPEEKRLIFEDINAKLAFGPVKVIDINDSHQPTTLKTSQLSSESSNARRIESGD